MEANRRQGLRGVLQRKESIIPVVFHRVLLYGLLGFLISTIHNLRNLGVSVAVPILGGIIPTLVIGVLLVFRINIAYERFLDSHKNWNDLINAVQNIARRVWVTIREIEPDDRAEKITTIRLIVACVVAAKFHLRRESLNSELESLVSSEQYIALQSSTNPPLQIAFWVDDYLQKQYERKCINSYQLAALHKLLDRTVDSLAACERTVKTPVPLVYDIHLKSLISLYCMGLPFFLVSSFAWFTGIVVALVSFALLGIEEISREMENPFGYDESDLPLDSSCEAMLENMENLISLEPSAANRSLTSVN
jgi:putative membrane protein